MMLARVLIVLQFLQQWEGAGRLPTLGSKFFSPLVEVFFWGPKRDAGIMR